MSFDQKTVLCYNIFLKRNIKTKHTNANSQNITQIYKSKQKDEDENEIKGFLDEKSINPCLLFFLVKRNDNKIFTKVTNKSSKEKTTKKYK